IEGLPPELQALFLRPGHEPALGYSKIDTEVAFAANLVALPRFARIGWSKCANRRGPTRKNVGMAIDVIYARMYRRDLIGITFHFEFGGEVGDPVVHGDRESAGPTEEAG